MKRFATCALIGTMLMLSACITSLHPFYTDEDVIFDTALLGTWKSMESKNETWQFSSEDPASRDYLLLHTDSNGHKADFHVRLFRLDDMLFLDVVPIDMHSPENKFYVMHTPPSHFVMLVESMEPTLRIALLSGKKLNRSDGDFPAREYLHVDKNDDRIVFTAPTKDLQDFLVKYAKTERATLFGKPIELIQREVRD